MRDGYRWAALGGEPGDGLLRRCARHEHASTNRERDGSQIKQATRFTPTLRCGLMAPCGGRDTTIRRLRKALDWQGKKWRPGMTEQRRQAAILSSPSRIQPFHRAVHQLPNALVPLWTSITACRFPRSSSAAAARRLAPLVYEAIELANMACLSGATMASERTAAAGRRDLAKSGSDPMAMLPFCGYNMADYFGHWFDMGERIRRPAEEFSTSTGSAPTRRAGSCGPVSVRTCASSSGSWPDPAMRVSTA